jgi:hypothetical protein
MSRLASVCKVDLPFVGGARPFVGGARPFVGGARQDLIPHQIAGPLPTRLRGSVHC